MREVSNKYHGKYHFREFLWWFLADLFILFNANNFNCIRCHPREHHDYSRVSKRTALLCLYCTQLSRQVSSYPDQYITGPFPGLGSTSIIQRTATSRALLKSLSTSLHIVTRGYIFMSKNYLKKLSAFCCSVCLCFPNLRVHLTFCYCLLYFIF